MSALTQNIVSRLRLNPDSPFARGLVGCWLMGNRSCWRSNKLLDLSPYNNHGVLTNMDPQTDWVHDGTRAGLDFDGVDDYVEIGSSDVFAITQFSISAWFKSGRPSTNANKYWYGVQRGGIFDLGYGLHFYDRGTGPGYEVWTRNSASLSVCRETSYASDVQSWHFVAGTFAAGTLRLYVDGTLMATTTSAAVPDTTPNPLRIGDDDRTDSSGLLWLGRIGVAVLHNRALTSAEISQLYEETRDGSYGSLVLTDEGSRQTTTVFIPKVPDKPIMRDVVAQRVKTSDYLELNTDSPLSRGLVGCWLMGNRACWRSNKLLDLSPYRNHGVLTNMDPQTDWVHDGERAALDFDGSNDNVIVSGTSRSIMRDSPVWTVITLFVPLLLDGANVYNRRMVDFYRSTAPSSAVILSVGNGSIGYWASPIGGVTVAAGVAGRRYVLAVSYDGSTYRGFLNGALKTTNTGTFTGWGDEPVDFGSYNHGASNLFQGQINFVLAYNRALTADEIRQLYNETKDGSYGSLVRQRRITHVSEEPKYASSIRTSVPTIITSSKTRDNTARSLKLNPDSPFAKGLVGCWLAGNPACKRSGKLLDLSPYRNHGTLTNMDPQTDWVNDEERSSLDFDGVDDYVLTSSNMRNTPFSVAFWYFRKTNSSVDTVFHYGNGSGVRKSLHLRMYASSTFRFGMYGDDLDVSLTAGLNTWSFIVCVLDSNYTQYVYEDGNLIGSRTAGGFLVNTDDTAQIGTLSSTAEFADVKINSILNYNRALSANEVKQLYYETRDGSYGSLVL